MGIFANKPMQKEVSAEIAAVPVTKSRVILFKQRAYSGCEGHSNGLPPSEISQAPQVPPLDVRMFALTCTHVCQLSF